MDRETVTSTSFPHSFSKDLLNSNCALNLAPKCEERRVRKTEVSALMEGIVKTDINQIIEQVVN